MRLHVYMYVCFNVLVCIYFSETITCDEWVGKSYVWVLFWYLCLNKIFNVWLNTNGCMCKCVSAYSDKTVNALTPSIPPNIRGASVFVEIFRRDQQQTEIDLIQWTQNNKKIDYVHIQAVMWLNGLNDGPSHKRVMWTIVTNQQPFLSSSSMFYFLIQMKFHHQFPFFCWFHLFSHHRFDAWNSTFLFFVS